MTGHQQQQSSQTSVSKHHKSTPSHSLADGSWIMCFSRFASTSSTSHMPEVYWFQTVVQQPDRMCYLRRCIQIWWSFKFDFDWFDLTFDLQLGGQGRSPTWSETVRGQEPQEVFIVSYDWGMINLLLSIRCLFSFAARASLLCGHTQKQYYFQGNDSPFVSSRLSN